MSRAGALRLVPALLTALLAAGAARAENPVVRFSTPLGIWQVELCAEVSDRCAGAAPNTVANFLSYLEAGDYVGTFIHRSVFAPVPFVVQGGTWWVRGVDEAGPIIGRIDTAGKEIENEFNQPNVRGTVSVTLAGNPADPDSGTSGWFINLVDNSPLLDPQLFTVFGVVIGDGMEVVDRISALLHLRLGLTDPNMPGEGTPVAPGFQCNPDDNGDCTSDPVPYLVYTAIPEPGAAAGGAAALAALAALGRGARPRAGRRGRRPGR